MILKRCGQSDLDEIIKIGRKTYYDTFRFMTGAETMEKYLDEAFHPRKIQEELNNPNSLFYFLSRGESLTAYMKVNFPPAQTDLNDLNSLELERIYVYQEYKGHGYGKILLNKSVSIAREGGCSFIWLGVWEKNKPALAFYRKMGFEIFDTHTFRMGSEIQNDFIMKKCI